MGDTNASVKKNVSVHQSNAAAGRYISQSSAASLKPMPTFYRCQHCPARPSFVSSQSFKEHLKQSHCRIEGGSYVCVYGANSVCATLPLEGVSDTDYDQHVIRQHIQSRDTGNSGKMSREGRGSTGSSDDKWGLFSATQNIPSALQNPRKGITRDFFTRTWGDTFIEVKNIPEHVALPEITPRHVEQYNRRIRKRNKLLLRLQQHEEQKQHQQIIAASTPHQSKPWASDEGSNTPIPAIFFSSNFNLEETNTFYNVFRHLAPSSPTSSASAGASKEAKVIQDNLLQHLEVVENIMCSHIASKSSAFFQSMSHLSIHMDQLRQNQHAVSRLRDRISVLQDEAVVRPLTLISLPRRKANIIKTMRILEVMSIVREVQGTIRVMLNRREFITAMDLITTASQLLQNELTTIRSFRNMSGELTEQENIIEKMVSADFTKYVSEDLNRPLDDDAPLLEEDQLIAVVFGVLRLNKLVFLDNLKEEIYAAINAAVKQCVAESVSKSPSATMEDTNAVIHTTAPAATGGGVNSANNAAEMTGVGEQARTLPLSEWLHLVRHLTICLQKLLLRYKAITDVIVQAVDASAGRGEPTAADEVQAASIVNMSACGGVASSWCTRVKGTLKEGLCEACDFAHDRCAKLLHVRSRNNGLSKMSVSEFMTLSGLIEHFVSATEAICGKKSSPFRQGLQGQCVVFVQRFHTDREGRLKVNLGSERWRPVPVPSDLQILCSNIDSTGMLVPSNPSGNCDDRTNNVNSDNSDDRTTASDSKSASDVSLCDDKYGAASGKRKQVSNTNGSIDSDRVGKDVVVLGGEEYKVVGVVIVLVRLIVEYAECASKLQMAAQSLLTGLADLLRRFNSDTCRLLLEAGAVSLGGLKTISTRHLALAHRCLHLLLALLPHLHRHFSSLLKQSSVEKTTSQLQREFIEHCNAIEAKIISVMGDQLDRLLSGWEPRPPVPSPAMSGTLKAMTRLNEAINGVLPDDVVSNIFSKLTTLLRTKLQAHIIRLNVSSSTPQGWAVISELTFYFNHLASLKVDPQCTQQEFSKMLWDYKSSSNGTAMTSSASAEQRT